MSNSDLKEEKKKRKRQEESTEEVAKKSKKSKKAEDAPDAGTAKDKKEKQSKKTQNLDGEQVAEATGKHNDVSMNDDFIPFGNDDGPMVSTDSTISRKDNSRAKKDKKAKRLMDLKEQKKLKKEKKAAKKAEKAKKAQAATEPGSIEAIKKAKRKEKYNKNKKAKAQSTNVTEELHGKDDTAVKNSNEEKKASDESTEQDNIDNGAVPEEPIVNVDATDAQPAQEDAEVEEGESGKKGRFIVFVGNLPFSATKEAIEAHFAKLKPFEIRMRTYKANNKFMGTCFIEFERFDHMQTALTKYHHSVFSDPKKEEGRKINVELSAGGGGNTAARQEKIKAKNEKLANERLRIRERREEHEVKQKERKEKKQARQGAKEEPEEEADGAADSAEKQQDPEAEPENNGIHPARLAMMQEKPKPWQQQRQNGGGPRYGGHRQRY